MKAGDGIPDVSWYPCRSLDSVCSRRTHENVQEMLTTRNANLIVSLEGMATVTSLGSILAFQANLNVKMQQR
eukprot:440841-Amphidinium_carterae.1